jgi:hypothetical protein
MQQPPETMQSEPVPEEQPTHLEIEPTQSEPTPEPEPIPEPKPEKPKKEKLEKPSDINVSDECWDAMVEAKGDKSVKECRKALKPLRKDKDGPCTGKENKKGFKKAVKELCKKEKDD